MERLLVDIRDLAPMLSLSIRTIRRLQERGMPLVRVGRRVLFDPVQVKEWLARGGASVPRRQPPERPRPGRPRRVVV